MWRKIVTWQHQLLHGETPLHSAIRKFKEDISLIESLLEHDDSQVNVRNSKDETPLHVAAQNKRCSEKLMKLLLDHGADAKATIARNGNTALHCWASRKEETFSSYKVAEILLQHGSDTDATNFKGDTPLHLCLRGKADRDFKLFWFVNKTKNINAANSKGETPLHLAVRNNAYTRNLLIIKILLDHGADLSKKDAKGENAYQAYCRAVDKDENRRANPMLQILLQSRGRKCMNLSLHVACLFHDVDSVQKLLRMGADVNAVDDSDLSGLPPTGWALIGLGDLDNKCSTVRLMLDYGADINQKAKMRRDVVDQRYLCGAGPPTLLNIALCGFDDMEPKDDIAIRMITLEHSAKLLAIHEKQVERGINVESVLSKENSVILGKFRKSVQRARMYNNWSSQCSEELKRMSETEIGESKLSFLDLLLASPNELAMCVKNKDLVKAFHAKKAMFPMYRGMLDAKLAKGQWRRKLVESAAVVMSDALRFADPSNVFFERTLYYCSNKDLVHLMEAME